MTDAKRITAEDMPERIEPLHARLAAAMAGTPLARDTILMYVDQCEADIAAMREEINAGRDERLQSEHRYFGLCLHCVSHNRLLSARAAVNARKLLEEA